MLQKKDAIDDEIREIEIRENEKEDNMIKIPSTMFTPLFLLFAGFLSPCLAKKKILCLHGGGGTGGGGAGGGGDGGGGDG